jgi:hypothetical protein
VNVVRPVLLSLLYARFLALPVLWLVQGFLYWDTEPSVRPLAVFSALHLGYGAVTLVDDWLRASVKWPEWWQRAWDGGVMSIAFLPPVLVLLALVRFAFLELLSVL